MMKLSFDLHLHSCLSPCGDEEMTPANLAAMCALAMDDTDLMADYLNEGFFNEPTCPVVNTYMALIAKQEGDMEKCQTHLDIAKANNPNELTAALIAEIEKGDGA